MMDPTEAITMAHQQMVAQEREDEFTAQMRRFISCIDDTYIAANLRVALQKMRQATQDEAEPFNRKLDL